MCQPILTISDLLQKREDVLAAEPEYNYTIMEDATPNDEFFTDQWGLQQNRLNMVNAWDITTGAARVKVGVFEGGIASHSDLTRIISGNFTPASGTNLSHGTHVAGIIGATLNNSSGIAGIAQVSMACLDRNAFVESLVFAAANNIMIINASFHYTTTVDGVTVPVPPSSVHAAAIAQYPGILICSAGNDGNNTDINPQYPADYTSNNIISVASTNSDDALASTSNYGATTVDLAAPGVGILSTLPGNAYGNKSGTSMAAPHVTGVAALIKSRYPNLTATQIKAAILNGVTSVSGLSGKCVSGGRLNAKGALDQAALIETTKIVSGDFNGDGKDDIASIVRVAPSHTQFIVRLSTGTAFSAPSTWFESTAYAAGDFGTRVAAGDFNGDGKDDLAVMYSYSGAVNKLYVYLSNGTGFSSSQNWYEWGADMAYVNNRFTAGDFNNDGKDDIAVMFRYPTGEVNLFVFLSTGNAFTRQNWYTWSADMTYVENRFVAGDFNGGGKDDLVVMFGYPSAQTNLFTFLSTESAFTRENWYTWSADMTYVKNRFAAGDFNGDGKDDTVVMFNYPSGQVNLFTFLSTGSSFARANWYEWSA